jgi:hypothetical protein
MVGRNWEGHGSRSDQRSRTTIWHAQENRCVVVKRAPRPGHKWLMRLTSETGRQSSFAIGNENYDPRAIAVAIDMADHGPRWHPSGSHCAVAASSRYASGPVAVPAGRWGRFAKPFSKAGRRRPRSSASRNLTPVRSTHKVPFNTAGRSFHGVPAHLHDEGQE